VIRITAPNTMRYQANNAEGMLAHETYQELRGEQRADERHTQLT
jgi:hypothetical protein